MNYLVKRTSSVFALRFFKSKLLYKPINFKSIKGLECNQNLWIITNNKRHYSSSVNILVMSEVGPVVAMLLGRLIQKSWPGVKLVNSKSLLQLAFELKVKIGLVLSLTIGILYSIYERHCEETPFTERKRFVMFSKKDYEPISDLLFRVYYNTYKHKLLPNNHRITKRVNRIVKKLLESNQEFDEISHKKWSIYVINDSKTANAFVLPTGQIFVYTGIVTMCDNESQLGAILAHELSHTLLIHGKEVISQEVLVDLILSFIVLLLWIRLNIFQALVGTVISSTALKTLLVLPKKRVIEMEADFMGQVLTAKACYDVREGSAFWMKMALNEGQPLNKWFNQWSTHPTNTTRYEAMDSYMESMIKLMQCLDCPQVSETDPRSAIRYMNIRSKHDHDHDHDLAQSKLFEKK